MKHKILIYIIITTLFLNHTFAQTDSAKTKREYVAYTLFYNVVPNNFNFPLIGFVNVVTGNHKTAQVGFVNTTLKNFSGAQVGFVNTTLGHTAGTQVGFVNATVKGIKGAQVGFVNTTVESSSGTQIGFVNAVAKYYSGFQLGFVNIAAKGIKGSQIGFVNITDSISGGIPIGFLSIVRKNGYRAFEASLNELYPVNLSFKIGVPQLYTSMQVSYNPKYNEAFAYGLGLGSLIPIGQRFYFNPEASSLASFSKNKSSILTTSLAANFRYSLNSRFQLFFGPSVAWLNYAAGDKTFSEPFFALTNKEINNSNRILIGLRAGLSYNLLPLQ